MPSPKNAVSTKWFVRVDGESEHLRPKVISFVSRIDVKSFLCIFHIGSTKENPHIHFVVELTKELQKQSFALQVKSHFEVVNRGYALDVWDGERTKGAPTYLFHEMGDVFHSRGWLAAEIEYVQKLGYEIAAAVSKTKERASQKLVSRAIKHFEDKTIPPTQYDILYFMVSEINEGTAYHPGLFKLKSYVEEVQIRQTPANQLNALTWQLFNSMWRV